MSRIVATYVYTDDRGHPVLRKVRREPKQFRMQAARYQNNRLYWKGEPGCKERWQPDWAPKAMYHLPVLLDALRIGEPVFLVEGERDADTLIALKKFPATTNWQGASAFTDEQAEWFTRGKGRINIVRDNDEAGAFAAWERYSRLIGVGVARRRLRLWVPRSAKDVTEAADRGLSGSALRYEAPSAVKELAFREGARLAARGYLSTSTPREAAS